MIERAKNGWIIRVAVSSPSGNEVRKVLICVDIYRLPIRAFLLLCYVETPSTHLNGVLLRLEKLVDWDRCRIQFCPKLANLIDVTLERCLHSTFDEAVRARAGL